MFTEKQVAAKIRRVSISRLRIWVGRGWVRPVRAKPTAAFSEADIARVKLISDLQDELGFDEDVVPVLLHLIDQIHGLRSELQTLHDAIEVLPEEARLLVRARLTKGLPPS
jgi:chaperone modulatory protein CbpM